MAGYDFHRPLGHISKVEIQNGSRITFDSNTAEAIHFVQIVLCADSGLGDEVERIALYTRYFCGGDQAFDYVCDQDERQWIAATAPCLADRSVPPSADTPVHRAATAPNYDSRSEYDYGKSLLTMHPKEHSLGLGLRSGV